MQQDMSNLGPSMESGQSADPFSMPRSPQWPEVQHACLEKNNFTCAACGIQGEGKVQVHHIIPFQYCVVYGRPELEFNPKNLIPLCEGPGTNDHHVAIEILPDFLARRKWPAKPVSADDQVALIALMNLWYGPKPSVSIDELIHKWVIVWRRLAYAFIFFLNVRSFNL